MTKLAAIIGLAAWCLSVPAWSASYDYFLKIDTIEGESLDRDHPRWIDVDNWSWGVSQVGASGPGGGSGVGKTVFDDFVWEQGVDKSVVPMFLGVSSGKHFKDATLDVSVGGERSQSFFQLVFSDVTLTKLNLNGSGDSLAAEAALAYGKIMLRYRPMDPKGSLGSWVEGGFDLQGGKASFSGDARVVEGLLLAGGEVSLDAAAFTQAVPEPATWAMMGVGLMALGGLARRARASQSN